MERMFAPYIDNLIYQASNNPSSLDDKTKDCLRLLFQTMQSIAVCGEDDCRELWITAERGQIEDFGDYEEWLAEGDVEDIDEFMELCFLSILNRKSGIS